ncbi:ABC transporter permease [Rhodococcus sp. ACPA4]|uniref:ABC transporter permease n=1 Tax=unclassified Rhodococcus (in: high G+C Gram-positive bacteria) TaxID=192944 RepID=UPI0005D32434|nr:MULTISPECIES: ABC transporter permease [unclassified Rhodococcus (in: high G+C Gram-positive bacteria)]KJF24332.1 ABC-type transport system involved in multi-copper enzyme maturation, permease component [Rhodococcus sp. AD45]PBC43231.1 ABC transporter permease [Rhodococcus sp. ACPA4]PSR42642.1 ABC transporter permease [Rhodococcus sp. AD45-ID]
MIWVTWRHHRTSLIVSLGIIAVLALTGLVGGAIIKSDGSGRPFGSFFGCFGNTTAICAAETALTATTLIATMLPVFLGALVGVTVFSRDIEQGTHVLGLTQSVSRARWFWTRVLVVFVPLTVAAALLGFVLEWTRRLPANSNFAFVAGRATFVDQPNLSYPFFQSSGLALGAYTFMALILGAALALLVRSSIGAMALTMVGVVGVLVMFQFVARPHYAPVGIEKSPLSGGRIYTAVEGAFVPGLNWEIEQGYVDIQGNFVDVRYDECTWSGSDDGNDPYEQRSEETGAQYDVRMEAVLAQQDRDMEVCLHEQGADHYEVRYHSADQFRRFQLTEAALTLVLSGLFLIPALWGLRRLKP